VLVWTAHFFLARNGFYWLVGWNAASGWGGGALSALQLVGIVQFTRLLLRTADESPRADRVLAVLVAAAVVFGATSLVFPHTLNEAFIAPFGMIMVISAFVVGVQRARQGSTAARYFVAAWVAPACGATLYVLKHTTFVPHTAFTEHAFQVGSALEMLLFSLALADRVRTLDRAIREKELRLALADVEHERALDVMRADAAARGFILACSSSIVTLAGAEAIATCEQCRVDGVDETTCRLPARCGEGLFADAASCAGSASVVIAPRRCENLWEAFRQGTGRDDDLAGLLAYALADHGLVVHASTTRPGDASCTDTCSCARGDLVELIVAEIDIERARTVFAPLLLP
jgi:hypothetical protein